MKRWPVALMMVCGCPEEEPSDMDHYLAAIRSESSGEAHRRCKMIGDDDERGECITANAARQAREGNVERAYSYCSALDGNGTWPSECVFFVMDIEAPPLEEAVSRCAPLIPYDEHCLIHAFSREASRLTLPKTLESEQAMYDWIYQELGRKWTSNPITADRTLQAQEVSVIVTAEAGKRLVPRLEDGFSREDCGNATREVCVEAYRYKMHHDLTDTQRVELCEQRMSSRSFETFGLPAYTPDVVDLVTVAYQTICNDPTIPTKGLPSEFGWDELPY